MTAPQQNPNHISDVKPNFHAQNKQPRPFPRDMAEARERNAEVGQHWFSKETLRFFNSRIGNELILGRFFVSSERYDMNTPRLYTLRYVTDEFKIRTVGGFQAYQTKAQAVRALKTLDLTDYPH